MNIEAWQSQGMLACQHTPLSENVACLRGVSHAYVQTNKKVTVLNDVTLRLSARQTCAIVGPSGYGKSTLLNILGLLDRPLKGDLSILGLDVRDATADDLARLRNEAIGFVFQAFNLLPRLRAIDNVALPLRYRGVSISEARRRAAVELDSVGLLDRLFHYPADLSGGQRQRVAIARALVGDPKIILADEPTGSLDGETADNVLSILISRTRATGATLVTVTHDRKIASAFDRCILVKDGQASEVIMDPLAPAP